MSGMEKLIDDWVALWNSYDLSGLDALFLDDPTITYFSSEKDGLMVGLESIREHHVGFGFVNGGKESENKLWLEDTTIAQFGSTAVVSSIWFFRRATGETMRGPVTFVCAQTDDGCRFVHMNFSNYK